MREKIVFFILGALLATLAYLAGNMNNAKAEDRTIDGDLIVKGQLTVSGGTLLIHNQSAERFPGRPINVIFISVDDEKAGIGIFNAFEENELGPKAKSELRLQAFDKGSIIQFKGRYGLNSWFLSSNKSIE